jgi:hypothetical protein
VLSLNIISNVSIICIHGLEKSKKKSNQGEKERKYLNSKTYDGSIPSNSQGWYLKVELYT